MYVKSWNVISKRRHSIERQLSQRLETELYAQRISHLYLDLIWNFSYMQTPSTGFEIFIIIKRDGVLDFNIMI